MLINKNNDIKANEIEGEFGIKLLKNDQIIGYISLQTCETGWEYTITDENYKCLDGGFYDVTGIVSVQDFLKNIDKYTLKDLLKENPDEYEFIDYDDLDEVIMKNWNLRMIEEIEK